MYVRLVCLSETFHDSGRERTDFCYPGITSLGLHNAAFVRDKNENNFLVVSIEVANVTRADRDTVLELHLDVARRAHCEVRASYQ